MTLRESLAGTAFVVLPSIALGFITSLSPGVASASGALYVLMGLAFAGSVALRRIQHPRPSTHEATSLAASDRGQR